MSDHVYTPLTYYVRPGGNDRNHGTTPTAPWATLQPALWHVDGTPYPVILDVTGCDLSGDDVMVLGARDFGPMNFDLDGAAAPPDNFFSRRYRQLRSSMKVVSTVHQVSEAFDPVSAILTVTVAEAQTPAALVGLRVIGTSPGVYGVVRSNTDTTIEVTNITGLITPGPGGPLWLCAPGASLTFGNASDFFTQALYLQAMCDWNLQGLSIRSHGKATALAIYGSMPVDLRLCDIDGIQIAGSGPVTIDGCLVSGHSFIDDSGRITATQSLFRGLDFVCHAGAGAPQFIGCAFDANRSAFGGGGGPAGSYSYRIENCGARGNLGAAFYGPAGSRAEIKRSVCSANNSTGAGYDILVQDPASLTVVAAVATTAHV